MIVGAHVGQRQVLPRRGSHRVIEPGKLADLVLVEGDVLRDISSMRRIRRVMLNGAWIR